MRFGLQARFIAIVLLVGIIALAALFAIRSQQRAHEQAITESVQALLDRSVAQPQGNEQQQGEIVARIEAANHRYRIESMLTLLLLGLILAGVALLVSRGLIDPIRHLAEAVRRIEDGDEIEAVADTERNDEIGELTRAFGTISDALVAMRQRMDHDAARPSPQAPQQVPPPPSAQVPPQAVAVSAPTSPAHATMVFTRPAVDAIKVTPAAPPPAPAPAAPAPVVDAPPVKDDVATRRDAARRLRLEDDLREAWQRDEMSVLYQPIHAVADGSMRGAEALLRWQHPAEGAISPDEFIPLAERSDLIEMIGRHVLVQACSDAGLWPSGGTPETTPFLSVNVSARQLQSNKLFEAVVEALRRSGLAASRLHLEIPVAALRSDDSTVAATIEQLRGLGVRIWLDAVGTDAADQARWMKMSVDGVKVGCSRIAGKSSANAADEAAIVASARALRIVAVVVGVEELAQLNVLREQGAELAQGYVLCRPVDTTEIGRRLLA